jgi:hypothetical protein
MSLRIRTSAINSHVPTPGILIRPGPANPLVGLQPKPVRGSARETKMGKIWALTIVMEPALIQTDVIPLPPASGRLVAGAHVLTHVERERRPGV